MTAKCAKLQQLTHYLTKKSLYATKIYTSSTRHAHDIFYVWGGGGG